MALPWPGCVRGGALRDAREPRCAVGGRVSGSWGDLAVVTAHFAYAGAEQRRAGRRAGPDRGDGLGAPIVVTGDFNGRRGTGTAVTRERLRRRLQRGRDRGRRPTACLVRPTPDRPRVQPRPARRRLPGRDRGGRRVRPPAGDRHVRGGRGARLTRQPRQPASPSCSAVDLLRQLGFAGAAPSTTTGGALAMMPCSPADRGRRPANPRPRQAPVPAGPALGRWPSRRPLPAGSWLRCRWPRPRP